MAASNIIDIGSSGRWQIVIDQVSQNKAANTSVVRVRGILYKDSSGTAYNNGSVSKSVSGTNSWSGSGPFSVSAYSSLTFIDVSFTVTHDANGYATVNYTATIGPTGTSTFGNGGSVSASLVLTRIPKRPSVPGTPQFSEVLPTSLIVSWAASTNNGGSAIDGYRLRRWANAEGTGDYVDSFANNRSRTVTGLTPGVTYRFVVYAHNGSLDNGGYSNPSPAATVQMLAGAWIIDTDGSPVLAIPYVNDEAGIPRLAIPYVNDSDGIPRMTS